MRRAKKLLITGLVLVAAALVIAWNTSAQSADPALGVTAAKRAGLHGVDGEQSVRGTVLESSIVHEGGRLRSFVLSDGTEQLLVLYNQTPPDAFGPKDVMVKGHLDVDSEGRVVLQATNIQVGCSSKY
jgi:cytochrome c-type biogenesis protein CcmE